METSYCMVNWLQPEAAQYYHITITFINVTREKMLILQQTRVL